MDSVKEIFAVNPLIIFLLFAVVLAAAVFLKHNFFLVFVAASIVVLSGFLFTRSGQDMLEASRNLPNKPAKVSCLIASIKGGVPIKSFDNPEECRYSGQKLG